VVHLGKEKEFLASELECALILEEGLLKVEEKEEETE
tara:strand:+ start:437 stop:547 length:111 start_codon:yes stop_codon:yes gene_type:complete